MASAKRDAAPVRGRGRTSALPAAPGDPWPLGASVSAGGVNFSVFSKGSTALELLLFEDAGDARPARTLALDPRTNRSYHYWHAFVPGLRPGQVYGYRAHGPDAPERGLRFDGHKVLLDPPRAGARETLSTIARSGAGTVLYVSCHPGSLARDAGVLVHEHGYALQAAGVMDMFPHTAHVESVALFTREVR